LQKALDRISAATSPSIKEYGATQENSFDQVALGPRASALQPAQAEVQAGADTYSNDLSPPYGTDYAFMYAFLRSWNLSGFLTSYDSSVAQD